VDIVKVRNQLDATKYAVLLPQHVSGTILGAVLAPSSPALHNPGGFPGMATSKRKLLITCTPDDGHIGARNVLRQ
jgi:hypothetical protein